MVYISIDMLDLGDANSCIVCLKDDKQNSCVLVIDGGNPSDGVTVVRHLNDYVLPDAGKKGPDIVLATHPDQDHCGGLEHVLKSYGRYIGQFWIHDPAKHMMQGYYGYFKQYLTARSSDAAYVQILESLKHADSLISTADRLGIPRVEPFFGTQLHGGIIKVLGPTVSFYQSLLPDFTNLERYLQRRSMLFYERQQEIVNEAVEKVLEGLESEGASSVVDEENEASPENQSSVVLEINVESGRYLFTGDVGVNGLVDIHARSSLDSIYWLQVPHHGSRRNLTSELISTMKPTISYISAIGNAKHPRRAVVNYLKKVGSKVYSTHISRSLWHHRGDSFPERSNYSTATPL